MSDRTRLSRLEVLGAWLGVWTPPRDAVVPPVPWRRVAAGVLVLALAAVAVAVLVAPAIDESKDERAAREQRELDARRAERLRRVRIEQEPRTGRLPAGAGARGVIAVEEAIGRDARRRFNPRAGAATCERDATTPSSVGYDCLAPVRRITGAGEQEGASGTLGIPYVAVLDLDAGTYAFCKINPVPSEQILPDPRDVVRLPAACRAPG